MSFIGKAVKKVFSIGKKIVKGIGRAFENKWVRMAVLAGLTVFTAGIGAAGFAGFGTTMATAGGGIGGFFSAVGSTMAAGFGSITTSVASLFGGGGAAAAGGAGAGQFGWAAQMAAGGGAAGAGAAGAAASSYGWAAQMAGQGATGAAATGLAAAGPATKSLLGRVGSTLFSDSVGGSFLRSSIMGGMAYMSKKQEQDDAERRRNNATVYGGKAFGGESFLPENFIRKPVERHADASTAAKTSQDLFRKGDQRNERKGYAPEGSQTLLNLNKGKATKIEDLQGMEGLLGNQERLV